MKTKYIIALFALLVVILSITWFYSHFSGLIIPQETPADTIASVVQDPAPPPTIYGFIEDSFIIEQGRIKYAENLASLLLKYNVPYQEIHNLAQASKEVFDVRRMKAGNPFTIFLNKDSLSTPAWFVYEIDPIDYLVMSLNGDSVVYRDSKPVETVRKTATGLINSSLWNTIDDQHLNPNLALELNDIYAWTVDFFGIERGDHFTVIYDEQYVDSTSIGISTIYASCFTHRGTPFYAFRYLQDSVQSYFDQEGKSLRKAFLKAPLKFSRISSRFSHSRLHPILKIRRPHHGIDYAAASGTPVYALGDGRVTHRGWDPKGGGNYIKIKHNSVYTTVYMHLSGFAKGIASGSRVTQGQLIGFVGKTGLATGPHLDFRVYMNNHPVDPLKIKAPPVEPVNEENMASYMSFIAPWRTELDKAEQEWFSHEQDNPDTGTSGLVTEDLFNNSGKVPVLKLMHFGSQ